MDSMPQDGKEQEKMGGQDFLLSVIMPVYNEIRTIEEILRRVLAVDVWKEIVIVDDGSEDGTVKFLKNALKKTNARIYRTNNRKLNTAQGNAIGLNILIRETNQDSVLIKIDDDGWVDTHLAGFVTELDLQNRPGAVWGNIIYVNPETLRVKEQDSRLKRAGSGMLRLRPEWNYERGGAIFAAPASVLREVGGIDMSAIAKRGTDTHLGHRLRLRVPTFFCPFPEMSFWHLGLTFWHKAIRSGKITEFLSTTISPKITGKAPDLIANGGEAFWKDEAFASLYERIK